MAAESKTAILVVGMHRSGTSAMARTFNIAGAQLSETLMPAMAGVNDAGFFEPQDIVELHEEFLLAIGSAWNDPAPFPADAFTSETAADIARRITHCLTADFADTPVFLIKDPRVSRLLPLWHEVLRQFGAKPRYLLCLRHPLEVAASLCRRDGFDEDYGLLLWLRYTLDTERDSRGQPRLLIDYDRLMADGPAVVEQANQALALGLPPLDAARAAEIRAFLSPSLRHHASHADITPTTPARAWTARLHQAMQAGDGPGLIATCDAITAELAAQGGAWDAATRQAFAGQATARREIDALRITLNGVQCDKAALEGVVREQQAAFEHTAAGHTEALRETYRLQAHADGLQAHADGLQAHADHLTGTIRDFKLALQAKIVEVQHASELMDRLIAERDLALAEREHLRIERDHLEAKLAATLTSTSWRVTMPLRQASSLGRRGLRRLRRAMNPPAPTAPAVPVVLQPPPLPRLVVLLDDVAAHQAVIDPHWPAIVTATPADYVPAPGDWVHRPRTGNGLSATHLQNVLLALAARHHDFIIVSHGFDEPAELRVGELFDALVVRAELFEAATWGRLPMTTRGRILRLLPGPADLPSRPASEIGLGPLVRDGWELAISPVSPIPPQQPLDLPLRQADESDPRPMVMVLPAFLAVGGVERNTIEIMRGLTSRYRFVVVTNERHEAAKGSLHHQLDGLADGVYDLYELGPDSRHLEMMQRIAADYRAELIWICNGSSWLSLNAQALRQAFADKVIIDQQAYDTEVGWIACFENPGIRAFDRFIAINRRIRDVFVERYGIDPEHVDQIYSAIDASRFSSEPDAEADALFRDAQDIPATARVFAQIGRLHDQKRPLDFLELARRSLAAGEPDVFVLIGDGPLAEPCRAFATSHALNNTRFIPYCEDLTRVYPALAGLVVTSAYEGLPIVTLEAMASGVPVIATDVGDIAAVFEEHGIGEIFGPVSDNDALWRGFTAWRDRLAELAPRARAKAPEVRHRFSSATIVEQYVACWDRALHQRDASHSATQGTSMTAMPTDAAFPAAMPASGPAPISVIIPTFNRGARLEECLQACLKHSGGVELEFVVVDDGSRDDTPARLERLARTMPNLTWTSVPNGGAGLARNVGVSLAKHDVIMFIGDDIRPADANFFHLHGELHARHPGTDLAVLGKLTWPNHCGYDVNFVMAHIQGRGGEQFGYADLSPYSFIDFRFFYTSNISLKKSVVADWLRDGFSAEFPNAGYEDIEFAYRMSQRPEGLRIFYTPAALGMHDHPYTVGSFIQRQLNAGMMAHVFARLHPEITGQIGTSAIAAALSQPTGGDDPQAEADYLAAVEGLKAWARLFDSQFNGGAEHWHDDLLRAVFEMCYGQGFILAWERPNANLSAAYKLLLGRFWAQMQRAIHHEVTGHVLASHFIAPWTPANGQPAIASAGDPVSPLRAWARRQPALVAAYRRLRGLP